MVSKGDLMPFLTRPVSLVLVLAIALMVVAQVPAYRRWRSRAIGTIGALFKRSR
jgi:putative tricarboxylic transport membrane protein